MRKKSPVVAPTKRLDFADAKNLSAVAPAKQVLFLLPMRVRGLKLGVFGLTVYTEIRNLGVIVAS